MTDTFAGRRENLGWIVEQNPQRCFLAGQERVGVFGALQLKAISTSFSIILQYPQVVMPSQIDAPLFLGDNTFYIAMLLAAFTILFGTRHLDATERHEGLVAAIAFESVVKLLAFIAVGVFVTFFMYDGFADIFERAREEYTGEVVPN